jgi:hypothetical protein
MFYREGFCGSASRVPLPGHRRRDRETLVDWAVICDDINCSGHGGTVIQWKMGTSDLRGP